MSSSIRHLNTSHVIFYLLRDVCSIFAPVYLNTSHVIFYPAGNRGVFYFTAFKYISCYLLSARNRVHKFFFTYLNTSHVIFYHIYALSCALLARI